MWIKTCIFLCHGYQIHMCNMSIGIRTLNLMRKINYVGDLYVYKLQFINIIKIFYSPTDAHVNCLKIYIKITLQQPWHVSVQSHHHQGEHYSCLLKLQLLNSQLKYIGVVNSVVMWLHILLGPFWHMYVALFVIRLIPNSATYICQQGPTNTCSHITTELTTPMYFNWLF